MVACIHVKVMDEVVSGVIIRSVHFVRLPISAIEKPQKTARKNFSKLS
jgi:hypothetical protein